MAQRIHLAKYKVRASAQKKAQKKIENQDKAERLAAIKLEKAYSIGKYKAGQRKKQRAVEKYKTEESFAKRPKFVQAISKRKGGKRGSSIGGQVAHKLLYPVKPLKKGRW